jgi:hypothetical protein
MVNSEGRYAPLQEDVTRSGSTGTRTLILTSSWNRMVSVLFGRFSLGLRSQCKGKIHPRTGHEGPEGEKRYNSTLSLTSALDGAFGRRHAPAALPPEKETLAIIQEAVWALGPVWTCEESLAATRIRPPDRPARSQPLYQNFIPAHMKLLYTLDRRSDGPNCQLGLCGRTSISYRKSNLVIYSAV